MVCLRRFGPPLRGGRSWRLRRERQGGRGLVSRAHARLNRSLNGRVRRALGQNCLGGTRLGRARNSPRNAHMPATPATDREPSPRPPCRCYLVCLGRGGVSRPIEGLDSFGAIRTLRMRRTLASSADASRPRNSSNTGVPPCMRSGRAFCFGTCRLEVKSLHKHKTPPCNRLGTREADPLARRSKVRSVRLERRLSRPSMGRDTLTLPKQTK